MRFSVTSIIVFFAMALPAQSQSRLDVRGTVGGTRPFLDEPMGALGGGALLFHFGQRLAIGPEFLFSSVSGFRDRSVLATGIFSLSPWTNRITPYVAGTIGLLRDHDLRINYTSQEWSGSGGAGARISLWNGLFIAPEIRLGSHAFPMTALHFGYSF
jgi:hypothetical protein